MLPERVEVEECFTPLISKWHGKSLGYIIAFSPYIASPDIRSVDEGLHSPFGQLGSAIMPFIGNVIHYFPLLPMKIRNFADLKE